MWIFRLTACGAGAVGYGARFDNRRIGRPADAAAAAGKLAKVHLGQHDRARLAQLLHHEGVLLRHMAFEKLRSRRRRHVNSVVVILQDDGDAMQLSAHFAALAFRIELPRLVERLFVESDDRVDGRALFVVGLDPLEVRAHQLLGGQRSAGKRRIQVGDCRGLDVQSCGARGHVQRAGESARCNCRIQHSFHAHSHLYLSCGLQTTADWSWRRLAQSNECAQAVGTAQRGSGATQTGDFLEK